MPYRLVSLDGDVSFELRPGATLVLGRALSSDLPVLDPTISRRHAEIRAEGDGVDIKDLGSSNGTFVNGARVNMTRLATGDRVVFGKVVFEVRELSPVMIDDTTAAGMRRAARAGTTIIRQVPVPDADQALEQALRASGVQRAIDQTSVVLPQHERDRLRLTLLLEISKALTRTKSVVEVLEKVVQFTFRLLDVDRVSILLHDERGELVPMIQRTRAGTEVASAVPLALAETAIAQKVAILSDNDSNGMRDTATPSGHVRSAACAPLIGSEGRVVGVLYVDSQTSSYRVTDEDLEFLVAFAGIGAVAIDNVRFAERIRQEALIRSNFERFFTPNLAAQIAAAPEAVRLGGERRKVAVLFSDIRGFTELAARMAPDEIARILIEYFNEMVECVFRHGGTLDKFIGDAIMAQWGAPLSAEDDADRALDSALDMMDALEGLNARWRAEGRLELAVGIGINYGEAFAGYIGAEHRLEYTVIGDTVNTAYRISAWAEGGEVVVTQSVRDALTRPRPFVERAPLTLRGHRDPLPAFRVAR
jgi:adenylate cyclase